MSQTQGLYNHPWAAKDQACGVLKRWGLSSRAGVPQGCGECGLEHNGRLGLSLLLSYLILFSLQVAAPVWIFAVLSPLC